MTLTSENLPYFQQLDKTKFLESLPSGDLTVGSQLPIHQALVMIKATKKERTEQSMAIERELAQNVRAAYSGRGLEPEQRLAYLLSLWMKRLEYVSQGTRFFLDDAEFERVGESVKAVFYLRPILEPTVEPYVVKDSITGWLAWATEQIDPFLTEMYGGERH
jgi:hypothetical protein